MGPRASVCLDQGRLTIRFTTTQKEDDAPVDVLICTDVLLRRCGTLWIPPNLGSKESGTEFPLR